MPKIEKLSQEELIIKISKVKEKLALLEAELEKREEERQHDAIDQMEDYLEQTNVSILSLAAVIKKIMGK